MNRDEFINNAVKCHGKKYDYSKVIYKNNKTKILIICNLHGAFLQSPSNHISKNNRNGCPKCAGKNKTTTEFIKQCKIKHNGKYDYSNTNYNGYYNSIKVICPIHGEFKQRAGHHLEGRGCKKCGIDNCKKLKISNTQTFINKSNMIHNNYYNYLKTEYKSAKEKVIVICPKHKEFAVSPDNHLRERGCPICKLSKAELKIRQWLMENKIQFENQKTFEKCLNPKTKRKLKFDFYIRDKNLLIEYDGEQHEKIGIFGSYSQTKNDLTSLRLRDKIKSKYAEDNGIKLLRIKYNQSSVIKNILEKALL